MMIVRFLVCITALFAGISSGYCQDYYPLETGNTWLRTVYTVITDTETIEGIDYYTVNSSDTGTPTWYIRNDGNGRIYTKYYDADETLYLDLRADVNDCWRYVVTNRREGDVYYDISYNVYLESKTDTIETPLGVFHDCCRYFFGAVNAVDADYKIWLAPGMGIVRLYSTSWGTESLLEKAIIGGVKYPVDEGLEVTRVYPEADWVDVPVDSDIILWFNYPVLAETIDLRTVSVAGSVSGMLPGTVGIDSYSLCRVRYEFDNPLPYGETITVTLSSDIADASGDSIEPMIFSFTTENDPGWIWFTEIESVIPSLLDRGDFDWGDYDNDGDPDVIVSGSDIYSETFVELYENNVGTYSPVTDFLSDETRWWPVQWIDYNSDGRLDIVVCGKDTHDRLRKTFFYRNDNGCFQQDDAMKLDIECNDMSWCDYDGDGYPDLALFGYKDGVGKFYEVYHNTGCGMEKVDIAGMPEAEIAESVLWLDVTGDGAEDLLIIGRDFDENSINTCFENVDGVFVEREIDGFESMRTNEKMGDDAADIDGDGDIDLYIGGALWVREGDAFINDQRGVETLSYPVSAFSDRDGDGDPDLFVVGSKLPSVGAWKDFIHVYENNGGSFTLIQETRLRKNVSITDGEWRDINGDNTLDLVLMDYQEGILMFENRMPSTGVQDEMDSPVPEELSLDIHPNPFNASVIITFGLKESADAELSIYGITGQRVRNLIDGFLPAGNHPVIWDGRDDNGLTVSSGVYIARLESGGYTAHSKVTFLK